MPREYQVIAAGSGWGALNMDTFRGPASLLEHKSYPPYLPPAFFTEITDSAWIEDYHLNETLSPTFSTKGASGEYRLIKALQTLGRHYNSVKTALENQRKPIVLGGDHSIAIATWSAAATHLHDPLGLIWIDAHLDAHTFATSPSQALFGMPVAALLGRGDERLTALGSPYPKILSDNIAYIGPREFEDGEKLLIDQLGIKVFGPKEIDQHGFDTILFNAKQWVTRNTKTFGISIDVDVFDPSEAPGTGACVAHGLRKASVLPSLARLAQENDLYAIEVVEFNPSLDIGNKTAFLIWELLFCLCGGKYDHEPSH